MVLSSSSLWEKSKTSLISNSNRENPGHMRRIFLFGAASRHFRIPDVVCYCMPRGNAGNGGIIRASSLAKKGCEWIRRNERKKEDITGRVVVIAREK
ncbi:hypothetical protein MTO96_027179 [Rhipicephalus appendiculatus]